VTANPFRFVIVAVLAISGILVIANAFDATSTRASSAAPPSPAASKAPKAKHTRTHTPKPPSPSPTEPAGTIDGVRIQVFNATTTTGLAASVQSTLEKRNATPAGEPGNAAAVTSATTVYYRSPKTDKANADYIAKRFFGDADVKPISQLPSVTVNGATIEVSKDVQVAIVVGEDYQP
jgi:LytR cell envelope-related transcriptional attenuator